MKRHRHPEERKRKGRTKHHANAHRSEDNVELAARKHGEIFKQSRRVGHHEIVATAPSQGGNLTALSGTKDYVRDWLSQTKEDTDRDLRGSSTGYKRPSEYQNLLLSQLLYDQ